VKEKEMTLETGLHEFTINLFFLSNIIRH